MAQRDKYAPGAATGAELRKNGETWTLVLVRQLRHSPDMVWKALTDPAQLKAWAPFDADRNLGVAGETVMLTTVNAPAPRVTQTTITRADAPRLLEYTWGDSDIRWELEPAAGGTRLTLWHNIDRRFIAMGAAGWHLCLDALDQELAGTPIGRRAGLDAMKVEGWHRLLGEYAKQLGVEAPSW